LPVCLDWLRAGVCPPSRPEAECPGCLPEVVLPERLPRMPAAEFLAPSPRVQRPEWAPFPGES
jgi:hypothetical protein